MRLFMVNPHRIRPNNEEKINQLKTKIKELEIDYILLSSSDRK